MATRHSVEAVERASGVTRLETRNEHCTLGFQQGRAGVLSAKHESRNERGVFKRSRTLGFALLGASWIGLARPARAAELVASGPAQCPDTAELAFLVERALGTPLAATAPLQLRVRFEAAGAGGWEGLALRATGTLFVDGHVALPGAGETGLGADMRLALGALSVCSTLLRTAQGAAAFVRSPGCRTRRAARHPWTASQ
jgi:prepilin-type processing-associated H-X9-DG protein